MKLREVYTPVFQESEEPKSRRLRSDFGSRRTNLECANCGHLFEKRVGPNTNEVSCPGCGHNRVRLSKPEKAKTKVMEMREHLELAEMHEAADCSMWVLANLIGDNRHSTLPTIQEALAGLAAIEPALGGKVRDIFDLAKVGKGFAEVYAIAEKMDLLHNFFEGIEDFDELKKVFKQMGGEVVDNDSRTRGDSIVVEFPASKEQIVKGLVTRLTRGMGDRGAKGFEGVVRKEGGKVFVTFRKK
jgi:predicted  nucleic acid-binding Zn-ribbon protein